MAPPSGWTASELEQIRACNDVGAVWHEPETDSTNDRARAAVGQGDGDAPISVFLTDQQHQGRGRRSNRWVDAPGALLCTLLVDAEALAIPQRHWPLVSLLTATLLAETVDRVAPDVDAQVKWPNDLYRDGNKLGGILVENDGKRWLIIGFGMNVANPAPPLAETTRPAATLADTGLRPVDVLTPFLDALANEWHALRDGWSRGLARFSTRHVLHGDTVRIATDQAALRGRVIGLDAAGGLQLLAPDGDTHTVYAGVVEAWGDEA